MKLVSLNVEGTVHTQLIGDYLKHERPDIVCLQEVYASVFDRYCGELGYYGVFAPMVSVVCDRDAVWGVAILSRWPIETSTITPYDNFTVDYPEFAHTRTERPQALLLTATIAVAEHTASFVVGNTHFTWAPTPTVMPEQEVNLGTLCKVLDAYPKLILCGDFNSPRGSVVFDTLAQRYTDNVPLTIDSTLDPVLHRAKNKKIVVDGVFSTPHYKAASARVVKGLSDHCALEVDFFSG